MKMQKPVHVHKENFESKSEKSSAFISICHLIVHAQLTPQCCNLNLEIGLP